MTSGVKNWYINFFIGIVGPCGMPIGDKNVIFFRDSGFWHSRFSGPPQVNFGLYFPQWAPLERHGALRAPFSSYVYFYPFKNIRRPVGVLEFVFAFRFRIPS